MPISPADAEHKAPGDSLRGFFCAASAYLIWGLSPIYWKTLSGVPPFEVLLHRIVWSFFFLLPLVAREKSRHEFLAAVRDRRILGIMLGTAVLVSINWLVFIWAIANDMVLQTSLGYYINPLLSVLLAMVILREHLRRAQALSVVLAGIGVLYLTVSLGQFPWVAFSLAISFGLYGLIRKVAPVSALAGLTIETLLLLPPAAAWLLYLHATGRGAFLRMGIFIDLSLMASALVTALPLLLFTLGARRLHLSTIGFMQYIVPSCFFLFAVFLFKEPVSPVQITTFIFIWSALALYSADSVLAHRKGSRSLR
ncbi:MAG: EamA family transporter RarD [Syntrophobacter sp.]